MTKKILITISAVIAVCAGVIGMSAFEAHIINVTAHIENALSVSPEEINFGAVFPQEYMESDFTVSLSDSFRATDRFDDVEYVINQKLKPTEEGISHFNGNVDAARNYCHTATLPDPFCYQSLCPFLSKLPQNGDGEVGELSYYDPQTKTCPPRPAVVAGGMLAKSANDLSDTWTVDLKVPPIAGYVGQDWPAGCPIVEAENDYGCDLWVEVTGLSTSENYPETGTAYIGYEDWWNGDFDYNDFGMDFSATEYYDQVNSSEYLSRVIMNFEAVIYDSGAEHYIHIKRPFNGSYTYKVTRSAPDYAGQTPAGTYNGSGNLDVVLFNTIKYSWPQININETVTVEVTLDDPLLNPKVALSAPRPDVDPFMANYDPWENPYAGVVGTFHLTDTEVISSTASQKNTPRIIPVGTEVPFILVIPETNWRAPHEDTTITSPYWHFTDYYDGLMSAWGPAWPNWYTDIDPTKNFVGYGGLAF